MLKLLIAVYLARSVAASGGDDPVSNQNEGFDPADAQDVPTAGSSRPETHLLGSSNTPQSSAMAPSVLPRKRKRCVILAAFESMLELSVSSCSALTHEEEEYQPPPGRRAKCGRDDGMEEE